MSLKRIDIDMYKQAEEKPIDSGLLLDAVKELMPQNKKLQSVVDLVSENSIVMWVSNGDWSMHELLISLLSITGAADVWLSTYALSETPARIVANLKRDGMIKDLNVLIDSRVETRTANTLQLLKGIATKLKLSATHAKTTIIKNDSWKIGVVGSANYTENVRWECGVIITNNDAVDFNINWMLKAFENGVEC